MLTVIHKLNLFRLLTIILLLVLISVPAFGGDSDSSPEQDTKSGLKTAPAAERNPVYHDAALFIAGLSNRQGTLAAYENDSAWLKYARLISQSWEQFDQSHLTPMRQWASQELSPADTATVFYPFSGPDFVNMYTLFPHAKTYLMIALESVGGIPDFSATDKSHFFAHLERSLADLLQLNFFITDKLNNSLGKPELKGIIPILLFFLAREKTQVLDVRYWLMKPDGSIEESPAAVKTLPGCASILSGAVRRKIKPSITSGSICAMIPCSVTRSLSLSWKDSARSPPLPRPPPT